MFLSSVCVIFWIRCWMAVRASILGCRLEHYRMKKMKGQHLCPKKNPQNRSYSPHWVCLCTQMQTPTKKYRFVWGMIKHRWWWQLFLFACSSEQTASLWRTRSQPAGFRQQCGPLHAKGWTCWTGTWQQGKNTHNSIQLKAIRKGGKKYLGCLTLLLPAPSAIKYKGSDWTLYWPGGRAAGALCAPSCCLLPVDRTKERWVLTKPLK